MAKVTKWRMATSLPGISVTRMLGKVSSDMTAQEGKLCGRGTRRQVIRTSYRMRAESCTLLGTACVVLLICL